MATASVVLAGDDSHEDLFAGGLALRDLLTEAGFEVRVRIGARAIADPADLAVLFRAAGELRPADVAALREAVRRGSGLLAIHSTAYVEPGEEALADLVGVRFLDHGPRPHESDFAVALEPHEVTDGVVPFRIHHEHYRVAVAPDARVLARREAEGGALVTARTEGAGRVAWVQFGHDGAAWAVPQVRALVAGAARWSAGAAAPRT